MVVPFLLLILLGCACCDGFGQDTYTNFIEKLISLVKTAGLKPFETKAELDGSLILKVIKRYKIPIKGSLNVTDIPSPIDEHPESCKAIKTAKEESRRSDVVYSIYPDGKTKKHASCDMSTNGGGWTIIQRRYDNKVDFNRNWQEYKNGFGDLSGDYWLGNEAIHQLTKGGNCTMRIDAVTTGNDKGYAEYTKFTVGSERESYKMNFDQTSGTADKGKTLSYHKGERFSTKDRDKDKAILKHCAQDYQGGWWYKGCYNVNPNGKKMQWLYWKSSSSLFDLKKVKMMIRC